MPYLCPGCGETRDISYENHRRIVRGVQRPECRGCPGPAPVTNVTEEHRRWWLVQFGVPSAALVDTTASAYVAQHGSPPELLALAAGLNGFFRTA